MPLLRRAIRTLLALVAVAVAAFALSLPVDAWLNRHQVEALTNVAIEVGSTTVRAHLARPADPSGRRPAVIMIHEFWGLNASLIGKADLLAAEGYVVVAPDTLRGTTTAWWPKALWQTLTTPDARVAVDLAGVMAWLRAREDVDPDRIVVMGFCYGGQKALSFALLHPAAVAGTAVFYGSLTEDVAALARLRGPVLGVFGQDDGLVPPAEVDAFERALLAAGVPHRLHRFDGVGHAFVTSVAGIGSDPVQAAAWSAWLAWLGETVAAH